MKWTLYNKLTGELGPILTGPDESVLERHLSDEVGYVVGGWRRKHHRVDLEIGEVVPLTL